jgi:hypothetical protein
MSEFGGEGLEQLQDRLSELSERRATNARILLEEIERRRSEAREQDQNFVALDAAQILDRLQRANTPFISSIGWNGTTTSPGAINVNLSVFNPDPVVQRGLFVHLFIGLADIAISLLDERFPRLTQPAFFGLDLNPSTSGTVNFSVAVPANIEPSNYLVNLFLFRLTTLGSGTQLDRNHILFRVT